MKRYHLAPAIALGLVMGIAPLAHADAPKGPPAGCSLASHRVTQVKPLYVVERQGNFAANKLRGAVMYVQAEPGLTREWLGLAVNRHVAAMATSPMEGCPFAVGDVKVNIGSSGTGFVVTIAARNSAQGAELLKRAQAFLQ